jgi:hypothetical protein
MGRKVDENAKMMEYYIGIGMISGVQIVGVCGRQLGISIYFL